MIFVIMSCQRVIIREEHLNFLFCVERVLTDVTSPKAIKNLTLRFKSSIDNGHVSPVCRALCKATLYRQDTFDNDKGWDPSFPLENTKSPHPENPRKLLKNYNLAHPRTVPKITAQLPPKLLKLIFGKFIVIFQQFSGQSRGGPNCNLWVVFQDFRGGGIL